MGVVNWEKAKTEYVTTNKSYREMARELGVSDTSVARKAKEDNWVNDRQAFRDKTSANIIRKTAEKISEDQSQLAASLNESALRFAQIVNEYLIDPKRPKPIDLMRLAQVWQILHDSIEKDTGVNEDQLGGIVMMVERTEEDDD